MSRTSSNPPALVQTRKRSSTVTSLASSILRHAQPVALPAPPPLQVGDCVHLTAWVSSDSLPVQLNPECWPGVREGDLVRVTQDNPDASLHDGDSPHDGFLFVYTPAIQAPHLVQARTYPYSHV